jgi:glucose-6-phosphate 1-dehydrogenase
MDNSHAIPGSGNTPEAYERLIFDILRGDTTLFSRWFAGEASRMCADKVIGYREQKRYTFPNYESGSMGPARAIDLLARDGRKWWNV